MNSKRKVSNPKTHCHRGHEMTEENTYRYHDGRRECRTCNRARVKGPKKAAAPDAPMKPKRTYNINPERETFKQYQARIHGGKPPVTTVPWEDPKPEFHDPWDDDVPLGQIR